MDARPLAWMLCLGTLLMGGGCPLLDARPAARQESPKPVEPKERPLLVDGGFADDETDAVDPRIQRYIESVDGLASRTAPPRLENAAFRDESPTPRVKSSPEYSPTSVVRDLEANSEPQRTTTAPAARGRETPPGSDRDAVSTTSPESSESIPTGRDAMGPPSPRESQHPVLEEVTIWNGSRPAQAPAQRRQDPPAVNAPISAVQQVTTSAKTDRRNLPPPSEPDSLQEQFDQRIREVLAGEYERARSPLVLVPTEQSEWVTGFVNAFIAIREGHAGDLNAAANAALEQIETLGDSLRRISDLKIRILRLCSEVRGFGNYEPIETPNFSAGHATEFVVYCELEGFVSDRDDEGQFISRFDIHTQVLTRAGDSVLDLKDHDVVDRCRNRRRDCFIPRLVRLPATLSPGEYVLKVAIADTLGRKVAEKRTTFRVTAR